MIEIPSDMQKAMIESFDLPYGYKMVKHYWYSDHGEMDDELDVRYSVIQVKRSDNPRQSATVHDFVTMEAAILNWLVRIHAIQQGKRTNNYLESVPWICKMLDIKQHHWEKG